MPGGRGLREGSKDWLGPSLPVRTAYRIARVERQQGQAEVPRSYSGFEGARIPDPLGRERGHDERMEGRGAPAGPNEPCLFREDRAGCLELMA